jgi:hypothetical protein
MLAAMIAAPMIGTGDGSVPDPATGDRRAADDNQPPAGRADGAPGDHLLPVVSLAVAVRHDLGSLQETLAVPGSSDQRGCQSSDDGVV